MKLRVINNPCSLEQGFELRVINTTPAPRGIVELHVVDRVGEKLLLRLFCARPTAGRQAVWEWTQIVPEGAHMVIHAAPCTKEEALEVCDTLNAACGRQ